MRKTWIHKTSVLKAKTLLPMVLGSSLGLALVLGPGAACAPTLDCTGNDPACNTELFLWQFMNDPKISTRIVPTHLYAGDQSGLSVLTIDPSTGALTHVSGPFGVGNGPQSIAISPDNKSLYIGTKATSSGMYAYDISSPESPTQISGSPYIAGYAFEQSAVTPDGMYVFGSANGENYMSFSRDATTGGLSTVSGSPFGAACVKSMEVDVSGKYLFGVSSSGGTFVETYSIDSSGALALGTSYNPSVLLQHMNVASTGEVLYGATASSTAAPLHAMTIDENTGTLTSRASSPYALGASNTPAGGVATGLNGQYVFTVNTTSDLIYSHSVDSTTGALTEVGTISGDTAPNELVATPDGNFLYAASNDGANHEVISYKINSDGSLTRTGSVTGPFTHTIQALEVRAVTVTE